MNQKERLAKLDAAWDKITAGYDEFCKALEGSEIVIMRNFQGEERPHHLLDPFDSLVIGFKDHTMWPEDGWIEDDEWAKVEKK